jgi:hypothetical protein
VSKSRGILLEHIEEIPQKPNIDLRLLCGSRFLNVGTKKEMRDFLKLAELALYGIRAQ